MRAFISLSFLLLFSCAGIRPDQDYALASVALRAAKEAKAHIHAKGLWYKAQISFQKGEIFLKDKHFDQSRSFFIESRTYSEKAELLSRLKQKKESGINWD